MKPTLDLSKGEIVSTPSVIAIKSMLKFLIHNSPKKVFVLKKASHKGSKKDVHNELLL